MPPPGLSPLSEEGDEGESNGESGGDDDDGLGSSEATKIPGAGDDDDDYALPVVLE